MKVKDRSFGAAQDYIAHTVLMVASQSLAQFNGAVRF